MTTDAAIEVATQLLRANGFSVTRTKDANEKLGLAAQRLWLCRWGTMTALVWARDAEAAELRVRHQHFDRRSNHFAIVRQPLVVEGEVVVREATDDDMRSFDEAGGKVPA